MLTVQTPKDDGRRNCASSRGLPRTTYLVSLSLVYLTKVRGEENLYNFNKILLANYY